MQAQESKGENVTRANSVRKRDIMLGLAIIQVSTLLSHHTLWSHTAPASVTETLEECLPGEQSRRLLRHRGEEWKAGFRARGKLPDRHRVQQGRKDMKQKPSCRSKEKRPTADRNETTQLAAEARAPGAGEANSCKNKVLK